MKKRFTLVELLGVIALIAILSVLGYTGYSYAMNSSKESATRALFARISAAMETCRTKNSFVPPSDSFAVIVVDPGTSVTIGGTKYDKSATGYQGVFYKTFTQALEMDSLTRHLNADNQLCDGWGNPIYFRYPGRFNRGGFDLISSGEDGSFAGGGSLPSTDISEYRDASGEWNVDDIGNF